MTIAPIQNGGPWKQKMRDAVHYWNMAAPGAWDDLGDARAAVNAVAAGMGLPQVANQESRLSVRGKFNAVLAGLGIPAGLDLYADFTSGRLWNGGPSSAVAAVSDTWSGGLVPNLSGAYASFAANELPRNGLGLHSMPTRTELVRGVNVMTGAPAWTNTNTAVAAAPANDSPANDNNARLITQGGTTGDGQNFARTVVLAAGVPFVISRWFKYTGSARFIRFVLSDNVANGFEIGIDLLNKTTNAGAVFGTATVVSVKVELGPNDWFRVCLVGTVPASASNSFGITTRVVASLGGNAVAAGNYLTYGLNAQVGSFAVPTIMNTSTTADLTVTGNRQVIDLSGKLAQGVAGFIKLDLKAFQTGAAERILEFNDGTSANRFLLIPLGNAAAGMRVLATAAGVTVADYIVPYPSLGVAAIAFSGTANFFKARVVGQADTAADTAGAWPAMTQLVIGGSGYTLSSYQVTKNLGLKFGPVDQASFDAMYALAQAA